MLAFAFQHLPVILHTWSGFILNRGVAAYSLYLSSNPLPGRHSYCVTPHHHLSTAPAKVIVPELWQKKHVLNRPIFPALLSVLGHWDCRHTHCKPSL